MFTFASASIENLMRAAPRLTSDWQIGWPLATMDAVEWWFYALLSVVAVIWLVVLAILLRRRKRVPPLLGALLAGSTNLVLAAWLWAPWWIAALVVAVSAGSAYAWSSGLHGLTALYANRRTR